MECFVLKGEDYTKNVSGYKCTFKERIIVVNDKLVWHGEISDIGGLRADDYKNGIAFGYDGFDDYNPLTELLEEYNLDEATVVCGRKSEKVLKIR